jgi:hypothetical protein
MCNISHPPSNNSFMISLDLVFVKVKKLYICLHFINYLYVQYMTTNLRGGILNI